ncbi:hypothetical protein D9M69_467030 [compost metagenome]
MNLRQYARHLAPDWDRSMGDPIDQMYANSGLFDGPKFGMPSMTLAELAATPLADGFRRPDGSDNSLGARLLYPQLILETIQANAMRDDGRDILSIWEKMVATTRSLNGAKADQPIIDTSAPEGSRSGRVAQLAEPETMVSITTGDRSFKIPTYSVGLMIADDAMQATTIDLVRIVMEAQSRGDKIRRVKEQLRSMVFGDIDRGLAPLPVLKAKQFDSSITTDNTITKRAYIKWLHAMENFSLGYVLTNIDTALDIDEGLAPKNVGSDNSKIATPFSGMNLDLAIPKMVPFKPEDFGAGILVGLDPRYAIQRFVNVSASYDAIEEYVMRKATGFRVDYGEMATRLMDEAWSVLSLDAD